MPSVNELEGPFIAWAVYTMGLAFRAGRPRFITLYLLALGFKSTLAVQEQTFTRRLIQTLHPLLRGTPTIIVHQDISKISVEIHTEAGDTPFKRTSSSSDKIRLP
jgi:hypothetical protein